MAAILRDLLKDGTCLGRCFGAGVLGELFAAGLPAPVDMAHAGLLHLLSADGMHIANPELHRALVRAQCQAVAGVCGGVLIERSAAANPGSTAADVLGIFNPPVAGKRRGDKGLQTLLKLRARCQATCDWAATAAGNKLTAQTIALPDAAPLLASPREEVAAWLRLTTTDCILGALRRSAAPAELPSDFVAAHDEQWFDFFRLGFRDEIQGNPEASNFYENQFIQPLILATGRTIGARTQVDEPAATDRKLQEMRRLLARLHENRERMLASGHPPPKLQTDLEEWLKLHQDLQFHWQRQAEEDLVHAAAIRVLLQLHWQQQAERDREILRQQATGHRQDLEVFLRRSTRRLSPDARRLASILGLLPGGIAPTDLETLFGGSAFAAAAELKNCGIVRVDSAEGKESAAPEVARLSQFGAVREYCGAHYSPAPEERRAVEEHYLELVTALAGKAGQLGGAEAIARLTPEVENVEALLLAALSERPPLEAEPLILAACDWAHFVAMSGTGTKRPVEAAAQIAQQSGDAMLQARCLDRMAAIALAHSQCDEAQRLYREAQLQFEQAGDVLGQANSIQRFGDVALARSDHTTARDHYLEARPMFEEARDLLGIANCVKSLGAIALAHSDHSEAHRLSLEAMALYQKLGDVLGQANCLQTLGDIALEQSDHDEARRRYLQALPRYVQVGDILGQANCIKSLGKTALRNADYDQALRHYKEAYPLFVRVGAVLGRANCIRGQGDVALARLEHDEARRFYDRALPLFEQVGSVLGQGNCLWKLGDLALAEQDATRAQDFWQRALAMFERVGEPWSQGMMHRRLARHAPADAERAMHAAAARKCWQGIHMHDLVAGLDEEFGAEAE